MRFANYSSNRSSHVKVWRILSELTKVKTCPYFRKLFFITSIGDRLRVGWISPVFPGIKGDFAGYLMYPEMWKDEFASFLSKARNKGIKVLLDTQCLPIRAEKVSAALNPQIVKNIDVVLLNANEAELLCGKGAIEEAARRLANSVLLSLQ